MDKEKTKSKTSLLRTISLAPNFANDEQDNQNDNKSIQQNINQTKDQTNVHQFILSQFKQKYDQLKHQFELKKKEVDELLYAKKETEIFKMNVDYYERQIRRLREEVEKYQVENQQNKHRFFVAENSRKDFEATAKLKNDQLKQILKQLQKQKITVVELRYQLGTKDKNFENLIKNIESGNQEISQKYEQVSTALKRTQNDLKIKTSEGQQMKKKIEQLQKIIIVKDQQLQSLIQKLQLSEYRSKHRIDDLEEQLRDKQKKQNEKIKKLQAQVKQLESKRKSEQFLLTQKIDAANYAQNIRKKQQQIASLEAQFRQLSVNLIERDHRIINLEEKLKNVCSIDLLNQSELKYSDALSKFKTTEQLLENRIIYLEKQLQLSKIRGGNNILSYQDPRMKVDFQQLLKNQIEENSRLKLQLSHKIDEIFQLKNKIQQQQIKQSLIQNQIDILRKKQKAEQKNGKIGFEIQTQNLKNDIDTLRRKIEATETRLNIKIKQAKDKDTFITNVIIGRSKQQDVPFVVAQLKRIFQAQYVNKLLEANLKINDLQSKLAAK